MKNFLYKLVFPVSGKLYFGKAASPGRYNYNKPNQQFVGPHPNVEVQNLLDSGEFCYWLVVKEFETQEELEVAEETYLKKVWPSENWKTRPKWLLNRSRQSTGWRHGELHHFYGVKRPDIARLMTHLHQTGQKKRPPDFHGKPWKNDDPRRTWDRSEVEKRVLERLKKANWHRHWGGSQLARDLNINPTTISKIASKLRQKWKP